MYAPTAPRLDGCDAAGMGTHVDAVIGRTLGARRVGLRAWHLLAWGLCFVRVSGSVAEQSPRDFARLRDALSSHVAQVGDFYELADVASARRALEIAKAIEAELSRGETLSPAKMAEGAPRATGR